MCIFSVTADKLYITPYYLLQNIEGNKALAERADTSLGCTNKIDL